MRLVARQGLLANLTGERVLFCTVTSRDYKHCVTQTKRTHKNDFAATETDRGFVRVSSRNEEVADEDENWNLTCF